MKEYSYYEHLNGFKVLPPPSSLIVVAAFWDREKGAGFIEVLSILGVLVEVKSDYEKAAFDGRKLHHPENTPTAKNLKDEGWELTNPTHLEFDYLINDDNRPTPLHESNYHDASNGVYEVIELKWYEEDKEAMDGRLMEAAKKKTLK